MALARLVEGRVDLRVAGEVALLARLLPQQLLADERIEHLAPQRFALCRVLRGSGRRAALFQQPGQTRVHALARNHGAVDARGDAGALRRLRQRGDAKR